MAKVTVELPEPDDYVTDDGANAPEWNDLALVGEFVGARICGQVGNRSRGEKR